MLTDASTVRMRATVARTFVDTVVIHRPVVGADSEGNPDGTLTTVATTVGRWGAPAVQERELAAQAGDRLDAVLTVAVDQDIKAGDIVDVCDARWHVNAVNGSRFQQKARLVRFAQ
jgi:hypothetical protein